MNEIIEISNQEDSNFIVNALNEYNLSKVPSIMDEEWVYLKFVSKNEKGEIVGGIASVLGYWGGLEIKILWVREDQRGKRLGTDLLNRVEKEAKAKRAIVSLVDTFDFQSIDFYLKNGYSIVGEHNGFPKGHKRVYFSKDL